MNTKQLRRNQAELIEDKIHHKKLIALDAITRAVILSQDDSIDVIVEKLKSEDTNYVIVVDENEEFIGEISVEQLIKIMAHASINEPLVEILDIGYHREINYTMAKDYMKSHQTVVKFDQGIVDVLKLIDEKGCNYIPVVDENKKVIGVITPSSLLDLLSKN